MGVDYEARKSAKKATKRARRDGAAGDAPERRVRKKKGGPRNYRLKGPCHKTPELKEEDHQWSDDADDELVSRRGTCMRICAPTGGGADLAAERVIAASCIGPIDTSNAAFSSFAHLL